MWNNIAFNDPFFSWSFIWVWGRRKEMITRGGLRAFGNNNLIITAKRIHKKLNYVNELCVQSINSSLGMIVNDKVSHGFLSLTMTILFSSENDERNVGRLCKRSNDVRSSRQFIIFMSPVKLSIFSEFPCDDSLHFSNGKSFKIYLIKLSHNSLFHHQYHSRICTETIVRKLTQRHEGGKFANREMQNFFN